MGLLLAYLLIAGVLIYMWIYDMLSSAPVKFFDSPRVQLVLFIFWPILIIMFVGWAISQLWSVLNLSRAWSRWKENKW